MPDLDTWERRKARLSELVIELKALSEDNGIGKSLRERRYKEYLKLAYHHLAIAEETATHMLDEVGAQELPARVPSPSSRDAMVVRFAMDLLGWSARQAAANANITTRQFSLIFKGTVDSEPEVVDRLLVELARQGIELSICAILSTSFSTAVRDEQGPWYAAWTRPRQWQRGTRYPTQLASRGAHRTGARRETWKRKSRILSHPPEKPARERCMSRHPREMATSRRCRHRGVDATCWI